MKESIRQWRQRLGVAEGTGHPDLAEMAEAMARDAVRHGEKDVVKITIGPVWNSRLIRSVYSV